MGSLTFNYGVMSAGKTVDLIKSQYALRQYSKKVLVLKPIEDTRGPQNRITSKAGLSCAVDYVIRAGGTFEADFFDDIDFVFIDEAQFLGLNEVEAFHRATLSTGVSIYAYGLKSDFRTLLFPGSKRLLELADRSVEIPAVCELCNKAAKFNMRCDLEGNKMREGDQVGIDDGTLWYRSVCGACYYGY